MITLCIRNLFKILFSSLIFISGRPEPSVRWWRNGSLIDSTDRTTSFKNVRTNELLVRNLQREDQHARYTCMATNNNISQPVSATVSIEIYCKYLYETFY